MTFNITPFDRYGNETWLKAVNVNEREMSIELTRRDNKITILRKLVTCGRLKAEIDPREFILELNRVPGVLYVFTHERDTSKTMVIAEMIAEGSVTPNTRQERANNTSDDINFDDLGGL